MVSRFAWLIAAASSVGIAVHAAEPGTPLSGVVTFESSVSVPGTPSTSRHRCASDGQRVWCWGDNDRGQLANGGRAGRGIAVPIDGLPRSIDDIAVGGLHACAVADRRLFCWGDNSVGQLGVAGAEARRAPVEVRPGVAFLSVDAGRFHSCAVTQDERVLCWGWNVAGQAGADPGVEIVVEPFEVMQRADVELALGGAHSCALSGGVVECWGENRSGQLGDGGFESRAVPAPVLDLPSGIERIASAQSHSCAATAASVWCWGSNLDAQTGRPFVSGDPSTRTTPRPNPVAGVGADLGDLALDNVRSCVAAGEAMLCWGRIEAGFAEPTAEAVEAWRAPGEIEGTDDPDCALADGVISCVNGTGRGVVRSEFRAARVDGLKPLPIEPTRRPRLLAGPLNACILRLDRELQCWGANGFGQLAQGDSASVAGAVPVIVPGNPVIHDVDFGVDHACAVTEAGLYCWGSNRDRQLGLADDGIRFEPVPVPVDVDATTRVLAGFGFTCLWASGGDGLRCFGRTPFETDDAGVLPPERPREVEIGAGALRDASVGRAHVCVLVDDAGEPVVRCLGRIRTAADDPGTTAVRQVATGLTAIESLSARGFSNCAHSEAGIVCWGLDHTRPDRPRGPNRAPFRVELPEGAAFDGVGDGFSVGGRHACVAGRNGETRCIGLPLVQACSFREATGDLGGGSGVAACYEVEFTDLAEEDLGWLPIDGLPSLEIDTIASGDEFSCAAVGRWVRCWGRGERGFAPPPDSGTGVAPVLRIGSIEPAAEVPIDLDPASSCPAFLISRVSLLEPDGSRTSGAWGTEVNLRQGRTRLHGGLNFGGYAQAAADIPGFAAFRIDTGDDEPRRVRLRMQGGGQSFLVEGRSTIPGSGVRDLVFSFVRELTETPIEETVILEQGFHIIRFTPLGDEPARFQVSALTETLDGGPSSFRYGAVVGGYLADGLLGYTALCTDDARALDVRTQSRGERGPIGAGDLRLQIENLTRRDILFDSLDEPLPR